MAEISGENSVLTSIVFPTGATLAQIVNRLNAWDPAVKEYRELIAENERLRSELFDWRERLMNNGVMTEAEERAFHEESQRPAGCVCGGRAPADWCPVHGKAAK
jgi:hypothetical protein